jgi:uncharacterized membrane protein YfcA
MDASFLGVPGIDAWVFCGLAAMSFVTAFIGAALGAAGGVVLLAVMAQFFPPAILIPLHTVVQLGVGCSRTALMWRWVMRSTLPPFMVGAVVGAAAGAQVFIALPKPVLQAILAAFVVTVAWLPRLGRVGADRERFAALGFGATFIGMFVSATGVLVAPFVASASPDRRNYAATVGALMMFVHIAKLTAFGILGIAIGAYVPLLAAMIATAAGGNLAARYALDIMPENLFRTVFKIIVTVLALRLLWVAARDSGFV